MKILLTGATGYIGRRLLPVLLDMNHEVICCVRAGNRFLQTTHPHPNISVVEVDFLNQNDLDHLPKEIDAAYFLMHSMSTSTKVFDSLEKTIALNFTEYIMTTSAKQVIYLSGLVPTEGELSPHLKSRWDVEKILNLSKVPPTVLRAGIVVGSGSASFEIIRDLVEKLPLMIAPAWLNNYCQPIAIRNVIQYLTGVLGREEFYGKIYDIGGPDVLTYKDMLKGFAGVRRLKRRIITVPIMSLKASSYWLFFVTSTSYKLAVNLVVSMKSNLICGNRDLEKLLDITPIPYMDAIRLAFARIEQNLVISSWKDALNQPELFEQISNHIQVPKYGCFTNIQTIPITGDDCIVMNNLWSIGGNRGWYYANGLWKLRGYIDRMIGGVGLRRGRTHPILIHPGDALDFWRVLVADIKNRRLLLFAETKTPGETWLEFKIEETDGKFVLKQKVTFRPNGITGRIYWWLLLPIHTLIFRNMPKAIVKSQPIPELFSDDNQLGSFL